MAITIAAEPVSPCPAYNDIEYAAISSQTGQPNFNYYLTVTNGSTTLVFRVKPDLNGLFYINIKDIVKRFVINYYPYGLNGWNEVLGGYTEFTINIGEEYGSTPTIHTGTNKNLKVWNASLTLKERATYLPSNYYPFIWLNKIRADVSFTESCTASYRDQDLTFYFLDPALVIDKVTITTYLITSLSSTIVGTADITNSTHAKYISINLSPSSISENLGGSTPFDLTENYYKLEFCDSGGVVATTVIRIKEVCSVRPLPPKWLVYLNRYGAFDPIEMTLYTKNKSETERIYYKGLNARFNASYNNTAFGYLTGPNPSPLTKRVLSSTYSDSAILSSEWLTDEHSVNAKDLFTTPAAFIQEGFKDYTIISPEAITYEEKHGLIDKNVQITVPVNYGVTEGRQSE